MGYRTLINNMVIGVSEQFQLTLNLQGVGYRAAVQNNEIVLNLGYSHPVKMPIPDGISVEVVQNTTINLQACDKEQMIICSKNKIGDRLNLIKVKAFFIKVKSLTVNQVN